MAFKFSALVSIIILAFQSALAPLIFENHAKKETPNELGRVFKLFIAVGCLGGLCLALFSYETLYIFTQPLYYKASVFMPVLYLSVIVTGLGMFSPGLHVMKKTKLIAIVVIITSTINVALNYLFITEYGLLGAAVATLISVILNYITLFIVSQRLYRIPFDKIKTFRVLFVFSLCFLIGCYLDLIVDISYLLFLSLKIAIISVFTLYLIREKMLNIKKVVQFLRQKISRK
jgi:O-antigen/teichoic acid export membrane protein